jgi:hypothetical protein
MQYRVINTEKKYTDDAETVAIINRVEIIIILYIILIFNVR